MPLEVISLEIPIRNLYPHSMVDSRGPAVGV